MLAAYCPYTDGFLIQHTRSIDPYARYGVRLFLDLSGFLITAVRLKNLRQCVRDGV